MTDTLGRDSSTQTTIIDVTDFKNSLNDKESFNIFDPASYEIPRVVVLYVGPVMMLMGAVGNTLAAIVVTRSNVLWRRTASLYILVLAVADNLTLLFGMGEFILIMLHHMYRDISDTSCKFAVFLFYFNKMWEAWVLVNMCMERLTAVYAPHKVKMIFTKKNAAVGLIVTTLLVVGFNALYFAGMGLVDGSCTYSDRYSSIISIWFWVDLTFASVIPFVIMGVSSALIVGKIIYSNIQRRHMASGTNIRVSGVTISLLIIALVFLLLTAPVPMLGTTVDYALTHKPLESIIKVYTVFLLFNCFMYLNYIVNFYVYCLSNPVFKREFLSIMCGKTQKSVKQLPITGANAAEEEEVESI